jgi:predicted metalloprotease
MGAGMAGLLVPIAQRFGIPGVLVVLGVLFVARYFSNGRESSQHSAVGDQGEAVQFVSFVLDDAQQTWSREFSEKGLTYRPAKLVVFQEATSTGCGYGASAVGPFYCPNDETVYIDLSFYRDLKDRFGAPGDFAQAYVIAHEIGHHVQNQLGVLRPSRATGADSESVRQELQADCLAGIWAHSTTERALLERGDIDEAMRAASAIGDDTLQRESGGAVRPESWTHGSSQQRREWFGKGLERGRLEDCATNR